MEAAIQRAFEPYRQLAARREEQRLAREKRDEQQRRVADAARQQQEGDEAARKDAEMRDDLVGWLWLMTLPATLSQAERDRRIAAARKNMDKLPLGTPRDKVAQA